MTTLDTRPTTEPKTIDAEFVDTTVATGTPVYVHNPHLIPVIGSSVGFLIALTGAAWSQMHDNPRTDLAFSLVIAMVFVAVFYWRAFWAWDQA